MKSQIINGSNKYFVAGIVSYGTGCALPERLA